jgi:hypothetical protein
VYVYLTAFKKLLPSHNQDLDMSHINTAFTTSCPVDAEITIYRREEWFKVFIHETFHSFGLDFAGITGDSCNATLKTMFHLDIDYNAFEAYTELWAEIINAIFCARDLINPKCKDFESNLLKTTEDIINVERQYSFIQMVKVLNHKGIRYIDLINDNLNSTYSEKTNMFAYFVVKTLIIFNINSFFTWCKSNNTNILQFDLLDNTSTAKFCTIVKKSYKHKEFLKNIEEAEKRKKKTPELRMTLSEMS